MNPRCRIERVAVPPVGEAPWRVAGAQAALVEQSLTDWGFDDWAWGTADLMSFLRRERYERYELFVAILSAAPATTQDPDDVVGALLLALPFADNTAFAEAAVWHRPGTMCASALLDTGLDRARAAGRKTFLLTTDHPPARTTSSTRGTATLPSGGSARSRRSSPG